MNSELIELQIENKRLYQMVERLTKTFFDSYNFDSSYHPSADIEGDTAFFPNTIDELLDTI